jgi:hypothetical protein
MNPLPYLAGTLLLIATVANADALRSQQVNVPGIQRVVIKTSGVLEIRPSTAERLTVEAEPHVLQKLENTLQQDTLTLSSKGSFSTHSLRYVLEIPKLRALTVCGSGDTQVGSYQGDKFDLELQGSGNATVKDITFEHLTLHISGSGNIGISGHGQSLIAEISGSGNIRAESLTVTRAEASIAGSGDISVQATKQLKAVIEGSGNIRYKGHPEVNQSISGAGDVTAF